MAKKILIGLVIAVMTIVLRSCLSEDPLMLPYSTMTPQAISDGWHVASPEEVGFDGEKLERVFRSCHEGDAWQLRAMLVARNGRLVGETYTKDAADISRPQAVWSCTKQVMAIITMMAIERGCLASLDSSIGELLPDMAKKYPDKAPIILRQLLTMTSGISFNNEGLNGDTNRLLRMEPESSVDYVLGLPMAPGTPPYAFHYNDGDPQIVSAILARALGEDVGSWSRRALFERMRISDYDWMVYPDGVTMGAFGLKLTPRDQLKFGQLIVDGGAWQGDSIISQQSVDMLTRVHVEDTGYQRQAFGLYWWISPSDSVAYMHGQGGQYVIADRKRNLVVGLVSEPNTQGDSQLPLSKALDLYRAVVGALE